jgi:peptide/nickel transport system permease protein
MTGYFVRRLLMTIPTVIGITLILFFALRLAPGGAGAAACGINCTPEQQEEVEEALGLNDPVIVQYWDWITGVVRGDLGASFTTGSEVTSQLGHKLPVTAELGIIGIIAGLLIAIPTGILSAIKQDSGWDYSFRAVAIGMLAIPSFWLGILLIGIGSKFDVWTPPLNYEGILEDPASNLNLMLVPGLLLGFALCGTVMRITRTQMLEVLRQDYVRTARAKGLGEYSVILRHSVRNALIPVVTVIGAQIPVLIGGTVVLETVFSVPGMGRYFVDAILRADLPVVQAVNLFVAILVVLVNLIIDFSYTRIDPRVVYS